MTEAAGAAVGRFVCGGHWTVDDGVVGPWFLPRFLAPAGLSCAHDVVLVPNVETCVDRIATRFGHRFTDGEATRHMHVSFSAAAAADRHVLRPTVESPGDVARGVIERLEAAEVSFC